MLDVVENKLHDDIMERCKTEDVDYVAIKSSKGIRIYKKY